MLNSNLLIIADDFTGANDTGVQLTKKGAHVDVYFDWQSDITVNTADVVVINTDSRALSKDKAQNRIKALIDNNNAHRPLYKKIDSTLRGNIGAEIETLLTETDYQIALIIAAFPDMGRVVKQGICYVNGVELINTEFATDPKTPITSSRIKQCLAEQTHLFCDEIFIETVRNQQLAQAITCAIQDGSQLLVIDSETNQDLELIVEQISHIRQKVLLVGSAGLINFLPTKYKVPTNTTYHQQHELMLVVAGSMSKITQKQIEFAAKSVDIWQVIDINIDDLFPYFTEDKCQHYCDLIQQTFKQNKNTIIRTCKDDCERLLIEQYCQKYQLTRQELGEYICHCLGKIVQNIAIHNLFLTGGDVAIAIAKSLGAIGFHIEGEVSPGVPYGKLIGNITTDYRIFTKAGGFGEQNIFTKSLELI